jgi:hypothetical protein
MVVAKPQLNEVINTAGGLFVVRCFHEQSFEKLKTMSAQIMKHKICPSVIVSKLVGLIEPGPNIKPNIKLITSLLKAFGLEDFFAAPPSTYFSFFAEPEYSIVRAVAYVRIVGAEERFTTFKAQYDGKSTGASAPEVVEEARKIVEERLTLPEFLLTEAFKGRKALLLRAQGPAPDAEKKGASQAAGR